MGSDTHFHTFGIFCVTWTTSAATCRVFVFTVLFSTDTGQLAFTVQCLCKINLQSISCPALLLAAAKTAEAWESKPTVNYVAESILEQKIRTANKRNICSNIEHMQFVSRCWLKLEHSINLKTAVIWLNSSAMLQQNHNQPLYNSTTRTPHRIKPVAAPYSSAKCFCECHQSWLNSQKGKAAGANIWARGSRQSLCAAD